MPVDTRTQQLSACFDHCIANGLGLAACAQYINDQGIKTAAGGAFTLATLPDAFEECGLLPCKHPKESDANTK